MAEYIEIVKNFILENKDVFIGLSLAGVLIFVISLASMPFIIAAIPTDYFKRNFGKKSERKVTPVALIVRILKNILGLIVFVGGVIMLFVPGQGVLTMVAGVFIMDFPGKHKIEKLIFSRPKVQAGLNFFRKKRKKEEFDFSFFNNEKTE